MRGVPNVATGSEEMNVEEVDVEEPVVEEPVMA
jgi:hypothetical protein